MKNLILILTLVLVPHFCHGAKVEDDLFCDTQVKVKKDDVKVMIGIGSLLLSSACVVEAFSSKYETGQGAFIAFGAINVIDGITFLVKF